MQVCVLLVTLFALPPCSAVLTDDVHRALCLGNEFILHVYSSTTVTFVPTSPPGPKRTIFEERSVKDPRFELTKSRRLVLREVTPSDAGMYHIMRYNFSSFQTVVHLNVSECLHSYQVKYGENFQHHIPMNGFLLEFSPMGSSPGAEPVLLWNRTDPSLRGRGQVQSSGRLWVARKVTTADQGNYTMRSEAGKLMSRSQLTLQGHTFNVAHFTKEFLTLPLFVPAHDATVTFTAARALDDPGPRRDPVELVRGGRVLDNDVDFLNHVAVYSYDNKVVITELSPKYSGVYDVTDRNGHLVASTSVVVTDKLSKLRGVWHAMLKSLAGPAGMFLALASLSLLVNRYPHCFLFKIIRCLLCQKSRPANPPRVNVQNYSPTVHQPSGSYAGPQQPGTPRKWSPKASPSHTARTPVADDIGAPLYPSNARTGNQWAAGLPDHMPAHPAPTNVGGSFDTEQSNSFSLPWASDCLHSSEDCVQFQSRRDKERRSRGKPDVSTLPLDVEATEGSSVYTSDKLNLS